MLRQCAFVPSVPIRALRHAAVHDPSRALGYPSQSISVVSPPILQCRRRTLAEPRGVNSSSEVRCTAEAPSNSREYRPTRRLLAGLSSIGVAETIYLSAAKLFSSPANICRTRGCVDVLSGPYSAFLGVPISLFGVVAYLAFFFLAAWPLGAHDSEIVISDDGETIFRSAEEDYAVKDSVTRPLLLALSSVMVVFSSYFMFLLTVVIRDTCPYCIFSAVLSSTLFFITAFVSRAVRDALQAIRITGVSVALSAAAAAAIFVLSSPGGLLAQLPSEPQTPPEITTQSDSRSIRIARGLKKRDTKMYGAYWCTHCYDQKQRLGKKAFSNISYVECDRGGVNSQAKLCREKRIPGYPTWEIDGELYPGELHIDDLEKLAKGESLAEAEDSN